MIMLLQEWTFQGCFDPHLTLTQIMSLWFLPLKTLYPGAWAAIVTILFLVWLLIKKYLKHLIGLIRVVVNNSLAWIILISTSRWGNFLCELKNYKTGSALMAKQKKRLLASIIESRDRGRGPRAGKTVNSYGVGGGRVSAFLFRLKVFPPGYPLSSLYQSKGTYVALLQQDWIFVLGQKNKCSKTCLGEWAQRWRW